MSRKRASRALIALVCVTLVLGVVAYFHNPKKSNANEPGKGGGADKVAVTPPAGGGSGQTPTPTPPVKTPGRNTQIALPGSSGAIVTETPGGATQTPPPAAPGMSAGGAKPGTAGTTTPPVPPATPKTLDATAGKTPAGDKTGGDPTPPTPVNIANSGGVLANGKALIDANNLVAGRRVLNEALMGGGFSDADAAMAKDLISKANQTLIFSPRRITDDPTITTYTVQSGDKPLKIAASNEVTWDFLARLNNISDPRKLRAGSTLKIVHGPFHAVVSKSKFTLDLYLGAPGEKGSMYVTTYRVGHGKNNTTPTGTWMVTPQSKLKNPKWWGTADEPAREAGDPQNPLGKFWIGLTGISGECIDKTGYGVHGTIEPASIGKESSHGCIRLVNEDVERVFEMLVEGKSTVIIKE